MKHKGRKGRKGSHKPKKDGNNFHNKQHDYLKKASSSVADTRSIHHVNNFYFQSTVIFIIFFLSSIAGISTLFVFKTVSYKFEEIIEHLATCSLIFDETIPALSVLDFFSTLSICRQYRLIRFTANRLLVESIICCAILQFGGVTATSLVLGEPPSWIFNNSSFPTFLLSWWLVYFSPFDLFWSEFKRNGFLNLLVELGSAVNSVHSITSWGIDKALYHLNLTRVFDPVIYFCLPFGVLTFCGGYLTVILIAFVTEKNVKVFSVSAFRPLIISSLLRSSVLSLVYCSFLFLVATNDGNVNHSQGELNLIDFRRGHAIIAIVLIANAIAQPIDSSVDIFEAIFITGFQIQNKKEE